MLSLKSVWDFIGAFLDFSICDIYQVRACSSNKGKPSTVLPYAFEPSLSDGAAETDQLQLVSRMMLVDSVVVVWRFYALAAFLSALFSSALYVCTGYFYFPIPFALRIA
jgi:hypothetical protein